MGRDMRQEPPEGRGRGGHGEESRRVEKRSGSCGSGGGSSRNDCSSGRAEPLADGCNTHQGGRKKGGGRGRGDTARAHLAELSLWLMATIHMKGGRGRGKGEGGKEVSAAVGTAHLAELSLWLMAASPEAELGAAAAAEEERGGWPRVRERWEEGGRWGEARRAAAWERGGWEREGEERRKGVRGKIGEVSSGLMFVEVSGGMQMM